MGNIVDTVESGIQNAILTANDSLITPKIEIAVRSINYSSRQDATSVTANSERGERVGITASFENVSEKNNTQHVLNMNDGTRNNIPDEVNEFSVPGTHFDRQPHTHHRRTVSHLLNITAEYRLAINLEKVVHKSSFANDTFTFEYLFHQNLLPQEGFVLATSVHRNINKS